MKSDTSILISFNSYGEWTKVVKGVTGNTNYIDTDTIKEHGGYVYWWEMGDYLKPVEMMSYKRYKQGDCGVNRVKVLSYIFYKQPMGEGYGYTDNSPNEWKYPIPESVSGVLLNYVCIWVD